MSAAPRRLASLAATSRQLACRSFWPLAIALGACHTPAAPAPHPGQAGERAMPAPLAATDGPGPAAPPSSCEGVGPLARPGRPLPLAELCSGERAPLPLPPGHQFEGLRAACDPDRVPAASDGPFSEPQPAPAGSGLESLRLLNAVAVDDVGMIHFGASYLVAGWGDAACLVDIVHEWAARPSYVETALVTRWQDSTTGRRVQLASERVMHEPLDESELTAGVSDVRSDICVRVVYAVFKGTFSRVEQAASPGACPPD